MPAAARKPATYQDLLRVPDHQIAEIIDGELYASPRPAGPHSRAASTLGMDLGAPYDRGRGGPGGWWIVDEPELHLGDHVVVPDLAGWRRERLPVYPADVGVEVPPDWVCEVLSPRTRTVDRIRKLPLYAAFDVSHAWLLDPADRTLEVYRLRDGAWVLAATFEAGDEVRAEPFEAVTLDLGELCDRGEPREVPAEGG